MTTIAAGRLSDMLQTLVDARLDTIDRMLLGRVNRQDRLAIVREVETQIFDLLGGRDSESLDRDDVLAVLARLDPPEAYLSDEATGEVRDVRIPRSSPSSASVTKRQSWLPKASGILGIVSVVLALFAVLLFFAFQNSQITNYFVGIIAELSFFGSIAGAFILGLLAVVLAARSRLTGGWAITGFVTGMLSMFATVIGSFTMFAG
jgi:hypothetical protein